MIKRTYKYYGFLQVLRSFYGTNSGTFLARSMHQRHRKLWFAMFVRRKAIWALDEYRWM